MNTGTVINCLNLEVVADFMQGTWSFQIYQIIKDALVVVLNLFGKGINQQGNGEHYSKQPDRYASMHCTEKPEIDKKYQQPIKGKLWN